jgi:hypothetical protein
VSYTVKGGKVVRADKTAAVQPVQNGSSIPDDIKRDIAKVVRSIDWIPEGGSTQGAGMCFYRAMAGWATLIALDIPASPALGGMVYRAGPAERHDIVAFCGEGYMGRRSDRGMLAHYFLVSDDDNIIDFSVGDWKETFVPEIVRPDLPPIRWTAPPLPDFFWEPRVKLTRQPPAISPPLGRAWYTGFADDGSFFDKLVKEGTQREEIILPQIVKAIELYALKERLYAVRNGHTCFPRSVKRFQGRLLEKKELPMHHPTPCPLHQKAPKPSARRRAPSARSYLWRRP